MFFSIPGKYPEIHKFALAFPRQMGYTIERYQFFIPKETYIMINTPDNRGPEGITVHNMKVLMGDSAFLIDTGSHTILYDSGFGFTGFQVAEKIKAYLKERPLDYIFLTHSHYDHALGSAYILRYYPNARVVAGEYAAGIFKREGALRVMKELDNTHALSHGVTDYPFLGSELRVDIPVKDGDIVTVGDLNFEVLNLPGHTKCSVGYYCKEKKLFLGSETLGVYNGDYDIFPSYLVGYQMALDSMDRVSAYDIEYLLAPHMGILSAEETKFFLANMKKASVSFAENIVRMLSEGKTTEDVIDDFKARFWHGSAVELYPLAALRLNTTIMTDLIKKELMGIS